MSGEQIRVMGPSGNPVWAEAIRSFLPRVCAECGRDIPPSQTHYLVKAFHQQRLCALCLEFVRIGPDIPTREARP